MLSTYVFGLLFIIVLIILVAIAAIVLFWLAYRESLRRRKNARAPAMFVSGNRCE
jgi:heme/copper-type cytochrome/quinol oxidase subunit 2